MLIRLMICGSTILVCILGLIAITIANEKYRDTSPDTVMDIDLKSPYKAKINGILDQLPDDELRVVYKLLKTYIDNK